MLDFWQLTHSNNYWMCKDIPRNHPHRKELDHPHKCQNKGPVAWLCHHIHVHFRNCSFVDHYAINGVILVFWFINDNRSLHSSIIAYGYTLPVWIISRVICICRWRRGSGRQGILIDIFWSSRRIWWGWSCWRIRKWPWCSCGQWSSCCYWLRGVSYKGVEFVIIRIYRVWCLMGYFVIVNIPIGIDSSICIFHVFMFHTIAIFLWICIL